MDFPKLAIQSSDGAWTRHWPSEPYVTVVTSTETVDRIRGFGADKVIDYRRSDFTTDDDQYDFIFDAVGKSTFADCRHLLKPKGAYISSELGPWCQNVLLPIPTWLGRGRRVVFPFPTDIPRSMDYIQSLIEKDEFSPLIDRSYRLEQIADAFRYVETGEKIGNVLISHAQSAEV